MTEEEEVRPASVFGYTKGAEDFRQAELLSKRLGGHWRYDHTAKQWHHWTGRRWAPDRTNAISRAVAEVAAREAKKLALDGAQQADINRVVKLFNMTAIGRALEALSTLDGYGTDGEDWDQVPWMLGVENGIVDLRENALIENPTPDMLVTKTTRCKFQPVTGPHEFDERAPEFMRFILDVTSSDGVDQPEMVSYLLLWFGASLFGFSPEQRFLLMTGIGRNGKGAMKHAILHAVGEYGVQPDANIYMRSKLGAARSDAARADLMDLKGKRVGFFSEPDGNRFNEEMLKAHTGGDIITARALYSNRMVSWEPTHSITFLVNNAPEVEDLGPSMGARVMVADFRNRYDGEKEDKQLYSKLEREAEGILAILAYSAKQWYDSWSTGRGLELPERVVEQSKAFMARGDQVAQFLHARTKDDRDSDVQAKRLYEAFLEWHAHSDVSEEAYSMSRFGNTISRKGYQKKKKPSGIFVKGLRLLNAAEVADLDDEE